MLSACHAAVSAEIVMFPGVRYTRDGDEDAEDDRKAKRHREEPEHES